MERILSLLKFESLFDIFGEHDLLWQYVHIVARLCFLEPLKISLDFVQLLIMILMDVHELFVSNLQVLILDTVDVIVCYLHWICGFFLLEAMLKI